MDTASLPKSEFSFYLIFENAIESLTLNFKVNDGDYKSKSHTPGPGDPIIPHFFVFHSGVTEYVNVLHNVLDLELVGRGSSSSSSAKFLIAVFINNRIEHVGRFSAASFLGDNIRFKETIRLPFGVFALDSSSKGFSYDFALPRLKDFNLDRFEEQKEILSEQPEIPIIKNNVEPQFDAEEEEVEEMEYEIEPEGEFFNFETGEPYSPVRRNPIGFATAARKKDSGGEVTLFFGTNRNVQDKKNANSYFGSDPAKLNLGKCRVTIPPGHKQGEIERPRKLLFFQMNENSSDHIVLNAVEEMTEDSYYRWLKENVSNSVRKSALVFIHGYNNTFAEAARRTAQIVYDLPFNDGIAGFFSWPSAGKLLGYGKDDARAKTSVPAFNKFVEDLVSKTGITQLHFIAHSMGSLLLTEALKDLSLQPDSQVNIKAINQVILAAPDVDKDDFESRILPRFKSIGQRRTLYASDKDEALQLSKRIRAGLPRIGEAGENLFVADGLDTVDASNVDSNGNHHSYMFEAREMLADMFSLIEEGKEPLRRRLDPRPVAAPPKYWLFRR